jgi:hypothetical protein
LHIVLFLLFRCFVAARRRASTWTSLLEHSALQMAGRQEACAANNQAVNCSCECKGEGKQQGKRSIHTKKQNSTARCCQVRGRADLQEEKARWQGTSAPGLHCPVLGSSP